MKNRLIKIFQVMTAASLLCPLIVEAARQSKARMDSEQSEQARMEYKANEMLKRGLELIVEKQEDRGLKMIRSIPENYPKSKIKYQAFLALGNYYVERRNYDLALKQFMLASEPAEDNEVQAEALYRSGICHYNLNSFDQAFMILRKVTGEFPWSVYANEAYYYIGMCHFKLGRWARAVEALEMVGTSVEPNASMEVLAEAGQRLFVKVEDEDLIVLADGQKGFSVDLLTERGDKESLTMTQFGKGGITYLGSIPTELGKAVPGDGVLQCGGNEKVEVSYVDINTLDGARNKKVISNIRMVSTAAGGFTDGAYREYTKGVFGDQPCFMRVKDMDGDVSDAADKLRVRVFTQYKVGKEIDYEKRGVQLDDDVPEIKERDSSLMLLTESGPHTGIFVGSVDVRIATAEEDLKPTDGMIWAMKDDEILLEYDDSTNINADSARVVAYKAKVLTGEIQDVKIEHRLVESLELKARKELIEAKIFLKLGQIFKEVGLLKQANDKADQGLERAESVIRASLKANLEREIVEEGFNVKWDLLMVKNQLSQAISVCNTLISMFPDSTLVDQALMKVAKAKLAEDDGRPEAMNILNGILRLKKSELKAEAQFIMAEAAEKGALAAAEQHGITANLASAMMAYKKCADNYPESPFAGQALDRIANYYIKVKDYRRAIELIEQVFQDYPDASFLDEMLLKWAIAAYRLGELQVAKDKVNQVLSEYPGSPAARKAEKFVAIIDKKLGG